MEKRERSGCPSDVTDEEWAFVAPYLKGGLFSEPVSNIGFYGRPIRQLIQDQASETVRNQSS
jgi:hypothetical protein